MALMTSEEVQYEMLTTLGRIEANTKNTLDTQKNIIYALIAVICAIVGVEFVPHSPINWTSAIPYSISFLGMIGGVLTILAKWNPLKKK